LNLNKHHTTNLLSLFNGHRFTFNGKEDDKETQTQDYGMRIYNNRLGRFLSIDPLTDEYPFYTPYQFASNTPIMAIDLDGLESQTAIDGKKFDGPWDMGKINTQIQVNRDNQTQAALKKTAIINEVVKRNSSTNNTEKPIVKLKSEVDAGIVGAAEIRILGVGIGGKAGISKPIISTTISEQGATNEVGGDAKLSSSLTYGIGKVETSINTSGVASLEGSLGMFKATATTNKSSTTELELFSVKAGAFVTGSLSLTINSSNGSGYAAPSSRVTGFAPADNTNVSRNTSGVSLPSTQQIFTDMKKSN
jgi:RHS repeat-associated protein